MNEITFGLEKEFILLTGKSLIFSSNSGISYRFQDLGRVLAEIQTHSEFVSHYPEIAVAGLKRAEEEFRKHLKDKQKLNLKILRQPDFPLDDVAKHEIAKMVNWDEKVMRNKYVQNLYGFTTQPTFKENVVSAGIHITICKQREFSYHQKVGKVFKELTQSYQILFDYAKFVKILDIEFMREIKKAQRVPGNYRVRGNDTFEYRSLPNNITFKRLEVGLLKAYKMYQEWDSETLQKYFAKTQDVIEYGNAFK
jgi:hypothetical protein